MKYKLNEINIDAACKEVDAYLIKKKTKSKERIQTTLSVEEILLNYMDLFGKDAEFTLDFGGGLSKAKIRLTVPGEMLNPFRSSGDTSDEEQFLTNLLTRMGQRPKWKYVRGTNTILYTPARKGLPDWGKLLTAIIAAIVLGLLVRVLPANISSVLQNGIIEPLLDTFLGFLNAVAGPMIFLSVVWGIYSIGDVSTFSEVGRHICIKYLLYLCIMTVLVALASLLFFHLMSGQGHSGDQFSELYHMVLDIVPDNLFTPFSRSNTLQIMFVGIIIGVTMLIIGKDTQAIADLAEQLGFVVDGIMGFISKLVPAFVFGSLFNIVASSNIESLAAGGKFFAGTIGGCILLLLIHTAITCVRMRITPLDLWKRTFSTFIIALSTASSSAAFTENRKTCVEKLGVSPRLANFGVPFGQLLYCPGASVLFWFAAVSVAESRNVEVSIVWYVTAAAICIILSAASPPVPGGMTASFTILFNQLALPVTDLAVVMSLTSILDFVVTATDVYTQQCVLATASKSLSRRE